VTLSGDVTAEAEVDAGDLVGHWWMILHKHTQGQGGMLWSSQKFINLMSPAEYELNVEGKTQLAIKIQQWKIEWIGNEWAMSTSLAMS